MGNQKNNSNNIIPTESQIPFHMKEKFVSSIQNIGVDGYNYGETEKNLKEATKQMLNYISMI